MGTAIEAVIKSQPAKWSSGYQQSKSGFQEQLNEAMKASDKKSTLKARADKEQRSYQINGYLDQLVHSGQKQNALNLEKNRLSSGMINLYVAHEKKDEKRK